MIFFAPLTIITAAFIGFAFGCLWYSPAFFLKAWRRGEGVTKEVAQKRSLKYILSISAYACIAHGAIASVLAVMFDILSVTTVKVAVCLGLLFAFGFIVTTRFIDMLYTAQGVHYDAKSQIRFLVSSGYYLCVVALMSFVLFVVA